MWSGISMIKSINENDNLTTEMVFSYLILQAIYAAQRNSIWLQMLLICSIKNTADAKQDFVCT